MNKMKNKFAIMVTVILTVISICWFFNNPPIQSAYGDAFNVTLTVRCDTLLVNMDKLDKEKHELVPDDGILFPVTTVTAQEGENAFTVLQREMRQAGMHLAFRSTPAYNAVYVEAINNVYEFDAGALSGWTYSVNGDFPIYGASLYILEPGDAIEWHYTCALGKDVRKND